MIDLTDDAEEVVGAPEASEAPEAPEAREREPPFQASVAATGRASCRACQAPIAKGSTKAAVQAWTRGGWTTANHHLACFLQALRVEECAASTEDTAGSKVQCRATPRCPLFLSIFLAPFA